MEVPGHGRDFDARGGYHTYVGRRKTVSSAAGLFCFGLGFLFFLLAEV